MGIINRIYSFSPKQNVEAVENKLRKLFKREGTLRNSWGINLLKGISVSPQVWRIKEHNN